nr:hypothetical protein [Tanacetum cinerariifolium]
MRRVNTFVPMESEVDIAVPEFVARNSKRGGEEELDQGSSKRQKTGESSQPAEAPRDKDANELVGNHTELYQVFEDMLKTFDRDDLVKLWSLESQKHIHDITWRLYNTCRVHHVSTKDGMDIYMLVKREYSLSRGVLTQMLSAKLLVEQDDKMSRELLRKIFMQIERTRR